MSYTVHNTLLIRYYWHEDQSMGFEHQHNQRTRSSGRVVCVYIYTGKPESRIHCTIIMIHLTMKLHKRTLAQIVDMSWQLHGSRREAASTSLSQALHYTGKSRSLGDCPGKKLGVSYASLTGSFSASFGCFGFISDIREKKGLIRASFGSFGLFF